MRSPFRLADVEVVVLLGVPLCGQGASPRPFAGGGRESHGPAKPFAWSGGGGALFAGESFVERLVGYLYPPSGGFRCYGTVGFQGPSFREDFN